MSEFDTTFDKDSLATIRDHSNQIFVLDYRDFYSDDKYLGDVLSVPELTRKNNSIYRVSFDRKINNNPSDRAVKTSELLKSKRIKIINDLKSKSDNDLDAKQAYMVMNSFEERWLEADNISFDSNDNPVINIWGINPIHIPEFVPCKIDVENESDDGHKGKEKKNPFVPTFVIIFIFITILLLIFNDCSNSNTTLLNANHRYHYDKTVSIEGIIKGRKTKLPIAGATVVLNKRSGGDSKKKLNYSKKLKSDKNGYITYLNMPKGFYDITVKKKYYYEKFISNLNISRDKFNLSRYLILSKKPFLTRLIDVFKVEK